MCILWKVPNHFLLLDLPKKYCVFPRSAGPTYFCRGLRVPSWGQEEENERTSDCGSLSFWAQIDEKLNDGLGVTAGISLTLASALSEVLGENCWNMRKQY